MFPLPPTPLPPFRTAFLGILLFRIIGDDSALRTKKRGIFERIPIENPFFVRIEMPNFSSRPSIAKNLPYFFPTGQTNRFISLVGDWDLDKPAWKEAKPPQHITNEMVVLFPFYVRNETIIMHKK